MKKISILLILAAIITGCAYAASQRITPSKNMSTKALTMNRFDELSVGSAIDVEYHQTNGNDYIVTVNAPENVMQYVKVEQRRDKVVIGLNRGLSFNGECKIKVVVKSPVLKEIGMSGATSFKASSINLPGQKFEVDMSGASNVRIDKITARMVEIDASGASEGRFKNLTVNDLEADASGASTIELTGKAVSVDLEASGASNIKAKSLNATNGKLEASGASNIKASVKNVYERKSSGASNISIN